MNRKLLSFLEQSPTPFHTVENVATILRESGFEPLEEKDAWKLEPGKNYYVMRNHSSLLAFRIADTVGETMPIHIAATHTDSPCFKIKENAELYLADKYTKLNTEGYGGMLLSTWLDRPLGVAGRAIINNKEVLVDFERDLVLIPNVAIHMNREANDGYKWNKQVDLMPLWAQGAEKGSFSDALAQELGVAKEEILGTDLYLYNRQKPSLWGANEEFISAPGLDDKQCLYASVRALIDSKAPQIGISMAAAFDNEEVGSGTKQGAMSTFLSDTLHRIFLVLGKTEEEFYRSIAQSFLLSADNAHAVHPNHPEHTDAENKVYMNEGVVVKSHAGQKYTSDAVSIAYVRQLAKAADVQLQYFANRSDKTGGSTLGNLLQGQVSMNAADIGLAQLAMHSSYETAGAKDTQELVKLFREFFK